MALSSAGAPAAAGIGLRFQHHQALLETQPAVAWLEVHTENYLGGGPSARTLDAVRRNYPLSLHGVGLSLGSAEGLDSDHLRRLREAIDRFQPGLVSEHLSWSSVGGSYLADLLPLPLTEEALDVACRNVDHAQGALRRRLLVENPSTYIQFAHSTIPEWEFLSALAARTGCGILCDVNNIVVSASNHGWDPERYIHALPPDAIGEIHVAGHAVRALDDGGRLLIDDHGSAVPAAVWRLYALALERFGAVPTIVEWDSNVPALEVLLGEAGKAAALMERDHACAA
ncbi:MAG TPA: DUF692 domain-containing protein [Ramlibacter sp.]